MLPAERRDVGQEFGRDREPGLPPGEDGLAELQRVPVDDDRGQQVEAGDPVVLPFAGSVAADQRAQELRDARAVEDVEALRRQVPDARDEGVAEDRAGGEDVGL